MFLTAGIHVANKVPEMDPIQPVVFHQNKLKTSFSWSWTFPMSEKEDAVDSSCVCESITEDVCVSPQ